MTMTRMCRLGGGKADKDDGTATIVRDMDNIRAYLPGNDNGGYNDEVVPVIPALDLGDTSDHILAVADLLSSGAKAEDRRGDGGFVAISIVNGTDGLERKTPSRTMLRLGFERQGPGHIGRRLPNRAQEAIVTT